MAYSDSLWLRFVALTLFAISETVHLRLHLCCGFVLAALPQFDSHWVVLRRQRRAPPDLGRHAVRIFQTA
jgi:hypothetical protein